MLSVASSLRQEIGVPDMKLAEMDRLTDRLQLAAVADAAERLRHTLVQHPDLRLGFIFPDGASSATLGAHIF